MTQIRNVISSLVLYFSLSLSCFAQKISAEKIVYDCFGEKIEITFMGKLDSIFSYPKSVKVAETKNEQDSLLLIRRHTIGYLSYLPIEPNLIDCYLHLYSTTGTSNALINDCGFRLIYVKKRNKRWKLLLKETSDSPHPNAIRF